METTYSITPRPATSPVATRPSAPDDERRRDAATDEQQGEDQEQRHRAVSAEVHLEQSEPERESDRDPD